MKTKTPIDPQIVDAMVGELGIRDLGEAKIREIVKLVNTIEQASGEKFIRMEMGVPGLEPAEVGTRAEIDLTDVLARGLYLFGTSGSEIRDMQAVLPRDSLEGPVDLVARYRDVSPLCGALLELVFDEAFDQRRVDLRYRCGSLRARGHLFIDPSEKRRGARP